MVLEDKKTIILIAFTATVALFASEHTDYTDNNTRSAKQNKELSDLAQEAAILKYHRNAVTHQEVQPLYAPWRNKYVTGLAKKDDTPRPACPFCFEIAAQQDATYYILKRGRHCVISLNPIPYADCHMLVIPYEHTGHLKDLSAEARTEIMEFTLHAVCAAQEARGYPGVNFGMNIGKAAGASIPDHLHMQVIPRTGVLGGFNESIARTPVITVGLNEAYRILKPRLDNTQEGREESTE